VELQDHFQRLLTGSALTEPEAESLFSSMLAGELDEPQIAAILALIQTRGPTVDELTGAARVMRARVEPVPIEDDGVPVIDTCGTGGAAKTFNVSTCAAIVAAGAAPGRLRVAKHGNRSRTGRGSAEVLAALGVNVEADPRTQARCLRDVGVCFCFAIRHHPAARHAAGVRRSLAFPTIFNLLGPLTNPARARRQLIGVFDARYVRALAEVLARLGADDAMVVHSDDGLDEIAISAPSGVARIDRSGGGASVRDQRIDPSEWGIARAPLDALRAGSVEQSARTIRAVLAGERGPRRDFVLVNAAGALVVAGLASDLPEGVAMAGESIDSGRASATLDALAEATNRC